MTILINGAYVLFLFSYLVRDILKLRLLSLVAGFLLIAFFLLQKDVSLAAVSWNVLFSIINIAQIYRLILERRPVRLRDEEHELHQLAFRSLTPRDFKRLCEVSSFEDASASERLVEPGKALERLMVILRGEVVVKTNDGRTRNLRDGQFVGEMSYLTGKPPTAEVIAARPTRYASIPTGSLKKLLEQSSDLRAAVQSILGMDLVHKLRA